MASVAADVAGVADALGIDRFAVMGASGGGPHALGCAALLPDRVTAAVSIAGLAPFAADGLDWFGEMASAGEAELRAACAGSAELTDHLLTAEFDPEVFTPADHAELTGAWTWLGGIAGQGMQGGIDGMVDDDLAYVTPWGLDLADVLAPVLLVHGDVDRVVPSTHSRWLAKHLTTADLWERPGAGHVSVLTSGDAALDWMARSASHA